MGRKVGMTQIYDDFGNIIPVTVIFCEPSQIIDRKMVNDKQAFVMGFEERVKVSRPVKGYFDQLSQKAGNAIFPKKYLKQFFCHEDLELGKIFDVSYFNAGDFVAVSALSKGKGFQGAVKRHKMSGGPASHGSRFHRRVGSVGATSYPARVWKGSKMPGHMGYRMTTVKNLLVVNIIFDKNLVLLKGAVPGFKNGMVFLKKLEMDKK